MSNSIKFLDIIVDLDHPDEGVTRLLKAVRPQWNLAEVSRSLLAGGTINAMYCCYLTQDKKAKSDAVIIRINRGNLEDAVDRDKEFLAMQVALAAGCQGPIYGVFNNGLVYKFSPGTMPTLHDLMQPKVIRDVAKALFHLHQRDVTSIELVDRKGKKAQFDKTVDEFSRMKIFADKLPSKPDKPELVEAFQRYRAEFPNEVLYPELEFVLGVMRDAKLPLSLIHGDMHKNNIVLDSTGQVAFIDYETSTIGYRYFDLGHFFVMWRVAPWLGWCKPGAPDLTPEIRRQYLEAYFQAKCDHEGRNRKDASPEEFELMDLQHQVIEFAAYFDFMLEPLRFINEPSVPPNYLHFHPISKESYYKLKGTIKYVLARIAQLDKVVHASG